ncbi:GntR family transcriptional regulator [Alicyclobacillus sp. SO9]|uniref:GntR family transcriptional regulator n=1 Tax=Alicyclobacillus sp. SO9 TaxID=2665646 RepID=UPI0018E7ADE0|nr:GntR family transcriptional regulator [Alicyclobacillus sp. SO9]QQE80013.1 GntR family transcriptional regulator [Alicyclobacillus sp. SO9]
MDAYTVLKEDILRGNLKPGERLREEQISTRLNLSRTPVREAIRRLEAEGLLIYSTNRGVSVRTYSFDDVRDAYNLRAQLEGYAATLAAENAQDNDIVRLEEANRACEVAAEKCLVSRTSDNTLDMVKANQAFHSIISELAKNRYLTDVITTVVSLPVAFNGFSWFSPDALRESVYHHQLLEAAIRNNDSHQARAIMASHIYHGRDHVLANMHKIER